MPNGQPNLGSFGLGQPGAQDAVRQAITARQQGTSPVAASSQVTPSAPSGPTPQPTPPQGAQLPPTQPETTQAPPMNAEAELILKALTQRLRAISKSEEQQSQFSSL